MKWVSFGCRAVFIATRKRRLSLRLLPEIGFDRNADAGLLAVICGLQQTPFRRSILAEQEPAQARSNARADQLRSDKQRYIAGCDASECIGQASGNGNRRIGETG